jgi:inosine/xanthosine triphosphate pyrophosphatase family protein
MRKPLHIVNFVTSSLHKEEELAIVRSGHLSDGSLVTDVANIRTIRASIPEILETDIERIVKAEAREAYRRFLVPCAVEHAGLIFHDYMANGYPGGLTKPMWNTLGDRFVVETQSARRKAVARSVVGYCDGMDVVTATGETEGTIADAPRGTRAFYWDTVFVPSGTNGKADGKTYAEIVDDPALGLKYKVLHLSQFAKALRALLEKLHKKDISLLWR